MIALMSPNDFRAFFRMNYPQYMWAFKNLNGNEMLEQKSTDTISERLHAGETMLAYVKGREFNPMTLVFFCPELRDRIDRGKELFQMATGARGATTTSKNEFEELVRMINAVGEWCTSSRDEKATRVIDVLKRRGYQCRLTPEGLNAGMDKLKYYAQGPDDFLDFTFAFHNALTTIESAGD